MEYHTTTVEEIQTLLETNIQNGLNDQEYKKRIKKHGQNIVARDKKIHWYSIFFQQFANPLMAILLIAALASSLIGDHGDALVIGIAILLNVIVGFIQEWRAETTAQALRKYHTKHSVVIRNGKTIIVESAHIVPGDIVSLAAGDQVPTDVRLVEATDLQIEEAILTGESLPINKNIEPLPEKTATTDMTNMAFAGTYVVSGKGLGIAVATGIHTELGKIASLVTSTERLLTPLQKQIKQLSWF
ncbi:HAD-IC family P-type ATPase, partial [Candidatus Babeliales bacterium]|nr:HAD-IC family P-type ATPase [Candidatus Babeliales bacterium]